MRIWASVVHYRLSALAATGALGVYSGAVWPLRPPYAADSLPDFEPLAEPDDALKRARPRYPQRRLPSAKHYKYLIAGGGTAAATALNTIASEATPENAGKTLLVTPRLAEEPVPVEEPECDAGAVGILGRLGLGAVSNEREGGPLVELVVGPSIEAVDPVSRTVTLDSGEVIGYEKLLLATGGFSDEEALFRRICSLEAQKMVGYASSSVEELERLATAPRGLNGDPPHVTVVGGSWAATALAASIISRGVAVTMSHSEPAYLARHLPKYASQDVLRRFKFAADDADVNVDTLAYSALNYVNCGPVPLQFRRNTLGPAAEEVEATVHVSTVFDAYDIMQFRSDYVVFAPTVLPSATFLSDLPTDDSGRLIAGPELSVYSDVYAAGACLSGGSSASDLAAWSKDRAITTGRHAARNMLGGRAPFVDCKPSRVEIELPSLCLKMTCIGDIDGSLETFGYFLASRERDAPSGGGELLAGIVFYVRPVRQDRIEVMGACAWDGQYGHIGRIDLALAGDCVVELMNHSDEFLDEDSGNGVYDRRHVEAKLRKLAEEQFKIVTAAKDTGPESHSKGAPQHVEALPDVEAAHSSEEKSSETSPGIDEAESSSEAVSPDEDPDPHISSVAVQYDEAFIRSPRERFLRLHKSARNVPLKESEILFVGDKSLGAASGTSAKERSDAALHEMFRKAREH